MTRSQLILTVSISFIVVFLVLVFAGVIPGLKSDPKLLPPPPTQITLWGLKEDSSGFQSIIASYKASHPNVNVTYISADESNYENYLIDNLAAGTGPDIFMLQNSWVPKFRNKISAAPPTLIDGAKVFDLFPPIVYADFVSGSQIWGLPVSIDTLALAYNRGIFDSKQLALPPATWNEVKALVPRIKELSGGVITKSAIALGDGESSVRNATDILSVMMLQLKNKVIDYSFQRATIGDQTGLQALNLYNSFSDPNSSAYAWDARGSQNSITSFAEGKTAMALVYKRDVNEIVAKKPDLNLRIAPLPQFDVDSPITIGNYWGLAVSTQSRNQSIAWNFINYAATNSEAARSYINASGMPPALRELIPDYQSNPMMNVFASQTLTAKSVPLIQYQPIMDVLNNTIEATLINRSSAEANLKEAALKINTIIR